MAEAFLISNLLLAITSLRFRYLNRLITLIIAISLALCSGLRVGGWDFDQYIWMIDNVRRTIELDLEFIRRLGPAKDLLTLWIIEYTGLITKEYWPIFLGLTSIAAFTKYFAALSLGKYSASFLAIYTIFISPDLEFSGMRSAAAIGLILYACTLQSKSVLRVPTIFLASASHISMVASTLIMLRPYIFGSRQAIIMFTLLIALASYLGSDILNIVPRGSSFLGKVGTFGALIYPMGTLLSFLIYLYGGGNYRNILSTVVALNLGVSLGLALPSVGISHRLLELPIILLLFQGLKEASKIDVSQEKKHMLFLSIGVLIVLQTYVQLWEGNWGAIKII